MSENMVERVARAIALEHLDRETRDAIDPDVWFVAESYYDLARAAIEAMRNYTDAMYEAGEGVGGYDVTHVTWEARIDAALKD